MIGDSHHLLVGIHPRIGNPNGRLHRNKNTLILGFIVSPHRNRDGKRKQMLLIIAIDLFHEGVTNLIRLPLLIETGQEFISTEAAVEALFSLANSLERLCRRLDEDISRLMPVCIIGFFQMIDVKEQERVTSPFLLFHLRQMLLAIQTVWNPRENIQISQSL